MRWAALWVVCAGFAFAQESPPASAGEAPLWTEEPRQGLTGGAFIGGGIGNEGVDFGGRLGIRWRVFEHVALSVMADMTFGPLLVVPPCNPLDPRGCSVGERLLLITPTAMARLEVVGGGRLGGMFVPKWAVGLTFGVGSALLSDNPAASATPGSYGTFDTAFIRFGLQLAVTRFPFYDFPFPLFVEVGGWTLFGLDVRPCFMIGVGL